MLVTTIWQARLAQFKAHIVSCSETTVGLRTPVFQSLPFSHAPHPAGCAHLDIPEVRLVRAVTLVPCGPPGVEFGSSPEV